MNDNNSVGGEGKESQSDNLWPFVGHFLKDHHNSTTILKAAALAKVLMLSCTNFPEKNPAHMFSIQYNEVAFILFLYISAICAIIVSSSCPHFCGLTDRSFRTSIPKAKIGW